jgi:hypothetical protein
MAGPSPATGAPEGRFARDSAQSNHEDTKSTKMTVRFIAFVIFVSSW